MLAGNSTKGSPAKSNNQNSDKPTAKARKLLNKEREALKNLPGEIERMEAKRNQITSAMQEPSYYRDPSNDPQKDQGELEELERGIASAYQQWETLEALS
jgi:ATP-binding cassette subfamily F protein uup